MSIVNIVEDELNIEVSEDIKALSMTANMIPLAPVGIRFRTNFGYAMLEHPERVPQMFSQISGSTHPTSSRKQFKISKLYCSKISFRHLRKLNINTYQDREFLQSSPGTQVEIEVEILCNHKKYILPLHD